MNPKTTIGLVVALLLAGVGLWWARSSSTPVGPPEPPGPKALLDLPFEDVTAYEIRSGASAACAFVKKDNTWEMTAPISGPGEQATINSDVRKLTGLEYSRSYAAGGADRPDGALTSLDKPLRTVKLTDKEGRTTVLKIGARQKLSKKTYVQKEGDETIYVVDADLNRDLRRKLEDYRGRQVSRYSTSDAVRISITGEQNYTLVKEGIEWMLESPVKARADITAVGRILRGIANLRIQDFVEDDARTLRPYGLENPRLVVAVSTEKKTPRPPPPPPASMPAEPEYDVQRETIRVAFGGGDEEKVFARLHEEESRAVFQVAGSVLKDVSPALADLRDKRIAVLPPNREQRLKVTTASGSIELEKAGTDWRIVSGIEGLGSDAAELAAVAELLKAIRDVRATGFEETELSSFGLDSPRAVLEIAAEGRFEPLKLAIGSPTPSKTGTYIKNEGEGFIAVIPKADADALLVEPMAFVDRSLLSFDQARATRIEIDVSGGGTRAVRRAGRGWQMAEPVTGNAEAAAVDKILADLSKLRARRVVARASEAAEYGLDHPRVRARVTVEAPAKTATTQPAEGGAAEPEPPVVHTLRVNRRGAKVYAMREGGSTIGEIDAVVLSNLEAELLETKVLSFDPAAARRLAFTGEPEFAFEKSGDTWKLAGESSFRTDPAKITELLETLRDLRAARFVRYSKADPGSYGLASPARTIRVGLEDGSTVALKISAAGPSGGDRYACVDGRDDQVFVLQSPTLTKLRKKVSDFQKAG